MDFQGQKLRVAFVILAIGMIVALMWHAWLGREGLGYPYNTFLFLPQARFTDFTVVAHSASLGSPYQDRLAAYFPAGYYVMSFLPSPCPLLAIYAFLDLSLLGLWIALILALRSGLISPSKGKYFWGTAARFSIALFFSYPIFLTIDRANLELGLVFLVSMALLCFQAKRFSTGLLFLFPAICLKFYPIYLGSLLFRPKHYLKVALLFAAFILASVLSMASFQGSLVENWHLLQENFHLTKMAYVIHTYGAAGSASPWNALRAFLGTALHSVSPHLQLTDEATEFLYSIYAWVALAATAFILSFVVFVETEFFRRGILVLLLMTVSVPTGGDYRLLYVNIALMILVLLPTRRPHDLWVVALLALSILPKREIYFPFLGQSDSGTHDISIGVFVTAPLLLISMVLLMKDGGRATTFYRIKERAMGMLNAVFRLVSNRPYVPTSS
jgi:hypothetical protein